MATTNEDLALHPYREVDIVRVVKCDTCQKKEVKKKMLIRQGKYIFAYLPWIYLSLNYFITIAAQPAPHTLSILGAIGSGLFGVIAAIYMLNSALSSNNNKEE